MFANLSVHLGDSYSPGHACSTSQPVCGGIASVCLSTVLQCIDAILHIRPMIPYLEVDLSILSLDRWDACHRDSPLYIPNPIIIPWWTGGMS